MLAGPIFSREALTAPRQVRHFLARSGYVGVLFVLMYTLGQVTFGWQQERHIGETARFGAVVFQIFSLIQLALVLFFSLIFAAGNISQEKDRKTLILLMMTDLRNQELVLGKLCASLLVVGVLLAASLPVFTLIYGLGGTSLSQIGWSLALTAAVALAAGSWGSLIAFWREKTFQTLAWSVLGMVLFLGMVEAGVLLSSGTPVAGVLQLFSPFRGMLAILDPLATPTPGLPTATPLSYVLAISSLALLLNGFAVFRLRVWNPSDGLWTAPQREDAIAQISAPTRPVWHNPVIWREIVTNAYGRRVFVIKLAYLLLFAAATYSVLRAPAGQDLVLGMISMQGFAFVGLALISLLLVNAQAVTALTTERDAKTLELLLVTDISAREFIYGKLGGILYNTKELIVCPAALSACFVWQGMLSTEDFVYVLFGFLALVAFAAMLGLHSGLAFENSRTAIANSLGTMFFLFLGIFVCMMLILEARSSFFLQLPSFLVFILGGSLALSASLTHKNPSPALTLSAFTLPFFTFYAITSFLLQGTLGVWLVVLVAYGFTTIAMLVPAVSEFDVALGRTTLDRG